MVKRFKKRAAGSAVAKVAATNAAISRLLNRGEKKGVDTPLGYAVGDAVNTNAGCFVVNLVQNGAGFWNRIGRSINLKSLRIRCVGKYNYSDSLANILRGNTLRMVVVWDKQPSGNAIPTFDTIFGKTDQQNNQQTDFLDPIKYQQMDRFSILRDVVISMDVPATYNAGTEFEQTFDIDEFIKLGNRETVYQSTTNPSTIANISTGALYIWFKALAATLDSEFTIENQSFARLRYTDV